MSEPLHLAQEMVCMAFSGAWSRDEAGGITVKSIFMTSGRSQYPPEKDHMVPSEKNGPLQRIHRLYV
jgi:hypothetical protein